MDYRAYCCFVYAQAERDSSYQHAHLIAHPTFLIFSSRGAVHLGVISDRWNPAVLQKCDGFLHSGNRRRINNDVASRIVLYRAQQQSTLILRVALLHVITQIVTLEAGDVLVRITQLQLLDNIVAYLPSRTRRERCNGPVWKLRPQGMQLPVFRTKLMAPLRNAMSFVDHKIRNGCVAQPDERIRTRQTLRRKIK